MSVKFTYLIQDNTFMQCQAAAIATSARQSSSVASSNSAAAAVFGLADDIELIDKKSDEELYPNLRSLPFGSVQDCIE